MVADSERWACKQKAAVERQKNGSQNWRQFLQPLPLKGESPADTSCLFEFACHSQRAAQNLRRPCAQATCACTRSARYRSTFCFSQTVAGLSFGMDVCNATEQKRPFRFHIWRNCCRLAETIVKAQENMGGAMLIPL